MQYLIDADWIINSLAGKKNAAAEISRLAPSGIGISIVTIGELYEGAFGFPNPYQHLASLRLFLAPFEVIGLDDPIMERFASIRSTLRRQGSLISDFDILVGATALQHDLTVLTFNAKHFERIPGVRLYIPS